MGPISRPQCRLRQTWYVFSPTMWGRWWTALVARLCFPQPLRGQRLPQDCSCTLGKQALLVATSWRAVWRSRRALGRYVRCDAALVGVPFHARGHRLGNTVRWPHPPFRELTGMGPGSDVERMHGAWRVILSTLSYLWTRPLWKHSGVLGVSLATSDGVALVGASGRLPLIARRPPVAPDASRAWAMTAYPLSVPANTRQWTGAIGM